MLATAMFSESDELVIPASRLKLLALALGAAGFVLAGGWMILMGSGRSVVIPVVGAASVVFFGMCGVLLDRSPAPGRRTTKTSERKGKP